MLLTKNAGLLLTAGLFFVLALHFLYYPPIYAFRDESDYLAMAQVFREGTVWIDQTDIPVRSQVENGAGHKVSDYAPGMSLLLLPLTLLNWKSIFLLNLLMHLAGAWTFLKFLGFFKIRDPFWALLYLFYPPFIFYSRTIMSDIPAAVLFLAGCLAYFTPKKSVWAGICWGIATMIREITVVYWMPFAAVAAFRAFRPENRANFAGICMGIMPFVLGIGVYHVNVFGSFWQSGYHQRWNDVQHFSAAYFWPNLRYYAVHWMLVYPFMPAALMLSRAVRRPEILLSITSGLLTFSFYFFHDQFSNPAATLVFGARFLFPVAPFFLAALADCGQRFLERLASFQRKILKGIIAAGLLSTAFVVHHGHQFELNKQAAMKDLLYDLTQERSTLFYDINAAELLQSLWGERNYQSFYGENWRDRLKQTDMREPVYLALRRENRAGIEHAGFTKEDLKELALHYSLEPLGEKHGLSLYRIGPLHTA